LNGIEITQDPKKQAVCNFKIFRYMDFYKFISLLEFSALWFSRLGSLQDKYEGALPDRAYELMKLKDIKDACSAGKGELKQLYTNMTERNISDGRDILVVNCWNIYDEEDLGMWQNYTSSNLGIAIRSTVGRLRRSIPLNPTFTTINTVKYVDFSSYKMNEIEANQANSRAYLKQEKYNYEKELRVCSLNIVSNCCLNSDGTRISKEQEKGIGQFDEKRKGIFIATKLSILIRKVILHPESPDWLLNLIKKTLKKIKLEVPVLKSKLIMK